MAGFRITNAADGITDVELENGYGNSVDVLVDGTIVGTFEVIDGKNVFTVFKGSLKDAGVEKFVAST
jgi:hypothetical protein